MSIADKRCLVLTSSWFPMGVESLEESLKRVCNQGEGKGKTFIIECVTYNGQMFFDKCTFEQWIAKGYKKGDPLIRTGKIAFKIPEVIMKPVGRPFIQKLPLRASNVFARDGHKCWYCGSSQCLTLDHIIPVSHGGKSSWKNIITCCKKCNNEKGDMDVVKFCKIKRCEVPKPFNAGSFPWLKHIGKEYPESWKYYLEGLNVNV